jgi:hypothetical protein
VKTHPVFHAGKQAIGCKFIYWTNSGVNSVSGFSIKRQAYRDFVLMKPKKKEDEEKWSIS